MLMVHRRPTPTTRLLAMLILTVMALGGHPGAGLAQRLEDGVLPLNGSILPDGREVRLDWLGAKSPRSGNASVSRRQLGETGAPSWRVIAPGLGAVTHFTDPTTQAGVAYEYRVQRSDARSGQTVDTGYWATGVDVPLPEANGIAFLAIDETIAAPLAPRIDRFEMDLVGAGWTVQRLNVPRNQRDDPVSTLAAARALKERIAESFWKDPFGRHALILLGHAPLVRSGSVAPDGHGAAAVGTDLFYADIDGDWPDDGSGVLRPSIVPDGKIDILVGRIDFASLTRRKPAAERGLLRAYLDKNHAWRHGLHGDLREAYGGARSMQVETNNLANMVGPDAVTLGGHHDVGEAQPWLMGVDFGDHKGKNYAAKYANKAVFALNFGSGKHRIDRPNNAMIALLAQPWYPVAVGWGARPSWRLHPMALGHGMGYSQLRTVNNGLPWQPYPASMDYVPTGQYPFRNPIWVNLVGDPTLQPFPVVSPRGLRVTAADTGTALSWAASDTEGFVAYELYRAATRTGPYTPIAQISERQTTAHHDADGAPDSWYMLRTQALKNVHAGSFHRLSQGSFATSGGTPVSAADVTLSTLRGAPVRILPPPGVSMRDSGLTFAPIAGVDTATLSRDSDSDSDSDAWHLTPDDDSIGPVGLRYFISDGLSTDVGNITVTLDAN